MKLSEPNIDQQDESPPFFRSWNQLYGFVLIVHAIILFLFYLFTEIYS